MIVPNRDPFIPKGKPILDDFSKLPCINLFFLGLDVRLQLAHQKSPRNLIAMKLQKDRAAILTYKNSHINYNRWWLGFYIV
ncbi:hypothetical protein TorRG33x02_182570 [Trema orientale]|uniref:Uncharacterized protein n=1 Tax=Trema orientale TaxID=63057 RepID=A0A2P5EKA2_TREOI|nr:hypothetical protein TorRG33x02_182570 [Trema orientale]